MWQSPLAIPNQISTISMHISSLVKIHWHVLKLLSWNEKSDMLLEDNSVKNWRNLPISNPKSDLYNINAHIKLEKIHCHLLKLLSGNKKSNVSKHMTKIYGGVYKKNQKTTFIYQYSNLGLMVMKKIISKIVYETHAISQIFSLNIFYCHHNIQANVLAHI